MEKTTDRPDKTRIFFVILIFALALSFARTGKSSASMINETFLVLFSDGSGLYAYDPAKISSSLIGPDFPVPSEYLLNPLTEIVDPTKVHDEIFISEGFSFFRGLISPSNENIIYVEAICENDRCSPDFNVWLIDRKTQQRKLLFDDATSPLVTLANTKDLIAIPTAWDESSGAIYFEAFGLEEQTRFSGIWKYQIQSEFFDPIDLGEGHYNGPIWQSPDNRYLLFPGFNSKTADLSSGYSQPTSLIKLAQIGSDNVSVIAENPAAQDYFFLRGWISSRSIPALVELSRKTGASRPSIGVPEATSGFQRPYTNAIYGYQWLEWTGSVYHPGDDYNGPGGGNTDCGDDIYAVANGTVRFVNTGVWGGIVIEHLWQGTTVYSQYGHVSNPQVSVGQDVSKGQFIADMGNVATTYCHLHWEIRESDHPNPQNGSWWVTSILSQIGNVENYYEDPEWWADNHGPYGGSCPSSGGVILYQNNNYDCGGQGDGSGYVLRSGTGYQNVPSGFDNRASSLRVPSGWSVRLYEHPDRGGASVCRNGEDGDFAGDTYDGGSPGLNDSVSSFEVFSNSSCGTNQGGSWSVDYFNDTNLGSFCNSGNLEGPYAFKDWLEDSPISNCNSDNWSARLRRNVTFQSGTYTFALGSDDWGRIKLNGETVVNNWQGAGQHYESRTLSAGTYEVTVEFADTAGHARIAAWWWGPGADMPRQNRDPNQWWAEYWGNKDLWWDSIVRVNEGTGTLAHDWGNGGPGYNLPSDRFSSRFERDVYFDCGTYRFHITNDDGTKLWIDGQLVLDQWSDQAGDHDAYHDLAAGTHKLVLQHYENGGGAHISLDWFLDSGCTTGDSYEPDNTYDQAQWIQDGSPQVHSIVPADDADWVKFSLNGESAITLGTTGVAGQDTRLWLYDVALNQLEFNDDGGTDNYSFIDRVCGQDALPPGTYYVKVDEFGNDIELPEYTLHFNITTLSCATGDDHEPDDTWDLANWIEAGVSQVHSIVPAGDVDWVKFTLSEVSGITLETNGPSNSDTRMWLYDSSLVEIEYNDDGGVNYYSFIDRVCGADPLPPGTYYVKIDEYETVNEIPEYTLQFSILEACPQQNPIFADGFESGTLSAWDLKWRDGSDVLVTAPAALDGNWGMRVLIDDNGPLYVGDESPAGEVSYKARFLFDPNSIAMGNGDFHTIFLGHDMAPANRAVLRIEVRRLNGSYHLRAATLRDDLTWLNTLWFAIADQPHEVEVEWDAAQSAAIHDGRLRFYIDSVVKANRTGIDNDTFQIDRARLGALANIDTTTRGRYFMDAFESYE